MQLPSLSPARLGALLDQHAPMRSVPLVPDLSAWYADDELPLWGSLEAELGHPVAAPFFCVPWPGAQALALYVRQQNIALAGRRVLDLGSGSGVASVACALRGAEVVACDIDPLACVATTILARRHGATPRVHAFCGDVLRTPAVGARFDVVLAGDLVYSRDRGEQLAVAISQWLKTGTIVVVADSGRPFFSPGPLPCVLEADVDVPASVEGASTRRVRVYAGRAEGGTDAAVASVR
ncbi:MAG: class I SAM-dependent methyltransferase [Myxococcota bacterium]